MDRWIVSFGALFCGLGLSMAPAFGAGIVRCTLADGRVEYRQAPCPGGGGQEIPIRNERLGTVVPKAKKPKSTKKKKRPARRHRHKGESASRVARAARERRCWSKRQALEKVQDHLRHGYRASESVRLRARRDAYEAYLRRFCADTP